MSLTHLFLVRHGESTGNAEKRLTGWMDVPLSPRGVRQARAAGRALRAHAAFDAVYASDLARARDTALLICDEIGFPREEVRLCPELRERSPGLLTGLTFQEAQEKHPEVWAGLLRREWDFVCPEGETNSAVSARVSKILSEAVEAHRGKKILLVSHGVAIAHLLRLILSIDEKSFPRKVAFATENAAFHRLLLREDGSWLIGALNESAHLAAADLEEET